MRHIISKIYKYVLLTLAMTFETLLLVSLPPLMIFVIDVT